MPKFKLEYDVTLVLSYEFEAKDAAEADIIAGNLPDNTLGVFPDGGVLHVRPGSHLERIVDETFLWEINLVDGQSVPQCEECGGKACDRDGYCLYCGLRQ